MARGRRKPTRMRELEGRPAGDYSVTEIKPGDERPMPPAWLRDEALAEWGRIVPELERLKVLSKVDRAALVAYCESWSTFVAATLDVQARGIITRGRDGNPVKNPSVAIARDAQNSMRALMKEFGLTPSARAGWQYPTDEGDGTDADVLDLFR
jgi:P27 family predicted phage terminase small subunit